MTAEDIRIILAEVAAGRGGPPCRLRSDNGPEFVAQVVRSWLEGTGSGPLYVQGHRIKIGRLGRMANSAFGGKLNLCGTCSHLFTMFVVYLVVDNKYNVYVR